MRNKEEHKEGNIIHPCVDLELQNYALARIQGKNTLEINHNDHVYEEIYDVSIRNSGISDSKTFISDIHERN